MNSYTYLASAEYEATLSRLIDSKVVIVTIFQNGTPIVGFAFSVEQQTIDAFARQLGRDCIPPMLKTKLLWELDQHAAAWEQRVALAEFASSGSAFPFDRLTTVAVVVGLICLLSVLFFINS